MLSRRWKIGRAPTLAVVLLELLGKAGWSLGAAPAMHTGETPLHFHVKDPIEKKAYLRCLVGLPELLRRGLCQLPSSGLATYYMCVLAAREPAGVPLDQSGKFYECLLKGKPLPAVEPIVPVAEGAGAPEPDEAPMPRIMCTDDDSDLDVARPARKKQRTRSGQHPPAESAWTELVPLPRVAEPVRVASPAPLPLPAAQPEELAVAAEQAASVPSALPLPAVVQDVPVALPAAPSIETPPLAGAPPPARRRGIDARRITLEGIPVHEERKPHVRINVTCKCGGHSEHRRSRGFTLAKGVTAGMGDAEAYAYLGAWLRAGASLSEEKHRDYRPKPEDVIQYARDHGWDTPTGWVPSST